MSPSSGKCTGFTLNWRSGRRERKTAGCTGLISTRITCCKCSEPAEPHLLVLILFTIEQCILFTTPFFHCSPWNHRNEWLFVKKPLKLNHLFFFATEGQNWHLMVGHCPKANIWRPTAACFHHENLTGSNGPLYVSYWWELRPAQELAVGKDTWSKFVETGCTITSILQESHLTTRWSNKPHF